MISADNFILENLAGGLRLVYRQISESRVGIMGVAVKAGSADDPEGCDGLAHFVEHTIFKGTSKRKSWHIINRMESVGGELNAFTSKEETVVYSIFPANETKRAAELISDLIVNSVFPEKELVKEREVVADEIDSYLDSPSDAVYDDFEDLIFSGSPIGHNILGQRNSLEKFTSQVCIDYLNRNYIRGNIVIFYSGPNSLKEVGKIIEKEFSKVPSGNLSRPSLTYPQIDNFDRLKIIESHQAHTMIGARVGGIYSPDRFTTALLGNIIGGPGMNSLLNVELRERRGLVYTVEGSTAMYTGGGALCVYFGCDPEDTKKCSNIIYNTIAQISDGYITPKKLEAAKKQYLGQLAISSENRENNILNAARTTLFCGNVPNTAMSIEHIKKIKLDDLKKAAESFLQNACKLTFSPKE